MNPLNAASLSIGAFVGIWCFATLGYLEPKVMTWVTFLTWASFYAAGGGKIGMTKAIASAVAGALISAFVVWLNSQLGGGVQGFGLLIFSFLLALLAWGLCQLSKIEVFSFIPGAFIGAASFFGAGAPLDEKLVWIFVSIASGAIMGLVSERVGQAITAKN